MNAIISFLQNFLSAEELAKLLAYFTISGIIGTVVGWGVIAVAITFVSNIRKYICAKLKLGKKAAISTIAKLLGLGLKGSFCFSTAMCVAALGILAADRLITPGYNPSPLACVVGVVASLAVFIKAILGFINCVLALEAISDKFEIKIPALEAISDKPEDEISATYPVLLEEPQTEAVTLRIPGGIFDNGPEVPFEWLQAPETTEDEMTVSAERTTEEREWVEAISDGEWEKFPPHMIPGIDYPPPSIPDFDSIQIIP